MTSRSYAEVIGDPIAHSKSPLIHNFWLEKLDVDAEYRALQVTRDELGAYFEARARDPHWRGCNITMPHKIAALAFVDKHRDPSFPVEPINMAVPRNGRLEGHNADTTGLIEPLLPLTGVDLSASRGDIGARAATVIGGGGVLYAVMAALSSLGFAPITVVVRDESKFAAIERDYSGVHVRTLKMGHALPPAALLVNASPLGMTGFPSFPYGVDSLAPDGIVFEMVYSPLETELLRAARARGLRTVDGLAMLIAQAAVGFHAFFGHAAPREFDADLRAKLTA